MVRYYATLSLSLLLLMLLSACTTMRPVDVDLKARVNLYETKSDQLARFSDWNMVGRLGVSNSEDGGSGHFSWRQNSSDSQMDFHGALGRGAWRLEADEEGAELKLADGTIHLADSIDQLVRVQVGWEIPVDKLSWWVRGLVAPGEYQERLIDEQGNLDELVQDGWAIEYGRYRVFGGISLPVKLVARQADWKVKLAISDWKLLEDNGSNE
jgi:outer membrane lipoprotein LolB